VSTEDPNVPHTTEVRTTYSATGPATTVVRRTEVKSNTAAWWVAGAVAVVAIAGVAYMVTSQPAAPNDRALTAAEQGRAQGQIEGAQATAATAQINAQAAGQSAQIAAQGEADRAAANRAAAEIAAARASMSASDASRDAAARAPQSTDGTAPAPNQ
jgi:hypothetical protein